MTQTKHPHNRDIAPGESVETKEGDVTGEGSGVTTDIPVSDGTEMASDRAEVDEEDEENEEEEGKDKI